MAWLNNKQSYKEMCKLTNERMHIEPTNTIFFIFLAVFILTVCSTFFLKNNKYQKYKMNTSMIHYNETKQIFFFHFIHGIHSHFAINLLYILKDDADEFTQICTIKMKIFQKEHKFAFRSFETCKL